MKNNTGKNIIIGVLVAIIIFLLTFIGLTNINLKENESTTKEGNNNSTIISKNDAKYLVSKYMHDINYYRYNPMDVSNLLHDGLTDKFKVFITIMNLDDILTKTQN